MNERISGIIRQSQELIEQAYQRGYKSGQENALAVDSDKYIEQGRNEAWDTVKKLYLSGADGVLPADEIRKIFGVEWCTPILKNFSASEAIEKLRKYEEQKKRKEDEIKVGDEVIINENAISSFVPGTKAIVTMIDNASPPYNVIIANGDTDWLDKDEIHKTGRHFPEIVEVLKKLKENE